MKIGIYGGSFDPPHKEHLNLAKNAVRELSLDKLFIVPARVPPHKKNHEIVCGKDRINMITAALNARADGLPIEVSDFEINSTETSYTYLTVRYFKEVYKDAELYFLVGTDMLKDFPTWKNPSEILTNAKLFVTQREGEDLDNAKKDFCSTFLGQEDRLIVSKYTGKKIASSDCRYRLLLGLSTESYFDGAVIDYINENHLYLGDEKAEYVRKSLPISRLTHTLGVMNLAKKYAKKLGADEDKAVLGAMLHDVAKYLDPKDFKDFTIDSDVPRSVVHQFLGAFIAETILNVSDRDVINAIKYHTTGRANMSVLEKIVFTADLLEEGRTYEEAPVLRDAVDKNFDEGFKLCLKRLKAFLAKSDDPVYFLTEKCYDFYIKEN